MDGKQDSVFTPVTQEEKAMLDVIRTASVRGDLAGVVAKRRKDGARVVLLCLVRVEGILVTMLPLAELTGGPDAIDDYEVSPRWNSETKEDVCERRKRQGRG